MKNTVFLIIGLFASGCNKVEPPEKPVRVPCELSEASYVLAGEEVSRYFYRYDNFGRLNSMTMKYGTFNLDVYYTYADRTIVQTEIDKNGSSVISYDIDNQQRIVRETKGKIVRDYIYSADGYLIETRDNSSTGNSIKYHYSKGNLEWIEYPDRKVELIYNSDPVPQNFSNEVDYSNDRRLLDFLGKRSKNLISKAVTHYKKDLVGNGGTYIETFGYSYDPKGNIRQLSVSAGTEKRYEINFKYSCETSL